jgi:chymotrypsin
MQALCGGSVLSARHILTAAHCVDGATSGTVILGAHFINNPNEPNQRRIAYGQSDFRMHESWDPSVIRNDIAIVRLPTAATLNQFIVPVALPTSAELNESFDGQNGVRFDRILT